LLTQRQLQLLTFIQRYAREHGVPPSFEEMRQALKLQSKSGIHRLVTGLEERGYIRRLAHRARALEIVRPPEEPRRTGRARGTDASAEPAPRSATASNVVWGPFAGGGRRRTLFSGGDGGEGLPIYGRIAAGTPIEALADGSETLDVPAVMLGDGQHYVLQVVGSSMVEAGILDGDYVVIKQTEHAESGEIVVALIDDREVTLKRLRKRGASIALEAANPAFETRIFGPHQVKVQGRLVGLLRRY
jgi:repressor LexA